MVDGSTTHVAKENETQGKITTISVGMPFLYEWILLNQFQRMPRTCFYHIGQYTTCVDLIYSQILLKSGSKQTPVQSGHFVPPRKCPLWAGLTVVLW